jgi:hypothetical protein
MAPKIDIRDIIHDGVQPDRAAENLTITDSARGGFTKFKRRRVEKIAAPLGAGAMARTIRIHELLHANKTSPRRNRKVHPIAENAIEDARVHGIYWPDSMPERANRDCLAAALADLRSIPPMAALARADDWNKSLLVALRAMAILNRLGSVSRRAYRNAGRLEKRLIAAFGPIVVEKLNEILGKVRTRRVKAMADFMALMRTDDNEPEGDGGSQPGKGSSGAATANPMRIVRLPMPEPCNATARRTALARSGARLNRARLPRAIATGSTAGLFIRQRYLPGGTYLFDASGSMRLTDERLNLLCQSVPAATVAYYSGWGTPDAEGAYGDLVIYAQNGRRADYCSHLHNGNEVDYWAIHWLLRQPAPRVYVGDGQFCGGPEGQDARAAALLAGAVASGQITWHKSIYDLEVALRS